MEHWSVASLDRQVILTNFADLYHDAHPAVYHRMPDTTNLLQCMNRLQATRAAWENDPNQPNHPNNANLPPAAIAALPAVPPEVTYRVCEGAAMGINSTHAGARTVCSECVQWSEDLYDTVTRDTARMVPLCYHCSQKRILTPYWTFCECDHEDPARFLNPIPAQRKRHLCDDCRLRVYDGTLHDMVVRTRGWLRSWQCDIKLPQRHQVPDAYPYRTDRHRLRNYVNDWSDDKRHFCPCGLDYDSIIMSYPLIPGGHHVNGVDQGQHDLRGLFRMCLICGCHVENRNFGRVGNSTTCI